MYMELVKHTQSDAASYQLKYFIDNGWPNNADNLGTELIICHLFKDELITGVGLIFKSQRIIVSKMGGKFILNRLHDILYVQPVNIPQSERSSILTKYEAGH